MVSKLRYSLLGISLGVILSLVSISKKDNHTIPDFKVPSISYNAEASTLKEIERIELSNAYIVSKTEQESIATSAPKYPTIDDTVSLYLVLQGKKDGETRYFSEIGDMVIDGRDIQQDKISRWDESRYGSLSINWFKVEPTQHYLSNTDPEWHWEKIDYAETNFNNDNKWSVFADVNPTHLKPQNGMGTMRYKVVVNYGNGKLSTPGAESYGKTGINDNVHRISVRGNTGIPIVDWAYSFMNQPYIWGSATPTGKDKDHQSDRYIGADCADLVVAAARKAGHNISYGGSHNISPNDLRRDTEFISEKPELNNDGIYRENGKKVEIDEDNVRIGDVVLYNRHVGILTQDLPPIGFLSSNDMIIHTLFKEPMEEPISQAYSPPFSIVENDY